MDINTISLPCVLYSPSDLWKLHNHSDGIRVITKSADPIAEIHETLTGEKKHLFGLLKLPEAKLFTMCRNDHTMIPMWSIALGYGMKLEIEKKTPYALLDSTEQQNSKFYFTTRSALCYTNDDQLIGTVEWSPDWKHLNWPLFLGPNHEPLATMTKCKNKPFKGKYPYVFHEINGDDNHPSIDSRLLLAWILWRHISDGGCIGM